MLYTSEYRDVILKSNKPLIQNSNFKKEINDIENTNISGIETILNLNYMKSWDTISSLRRMTLHKDFFIVAEYNAYKDEKGNTLKVYAYKRHMEHIEKIVMNIEIIIFGGMLKMTFLCFLNIQIRFY